LEVEWSEPSAMLDDAYMREIKEQRARETTINSKNCQAAGLRRPACAGVDIRVVLLQGVLEWRSIASSEQHVIK
jgi:hypothetical protein